MGIHLLRPLDVVDAATSLRIAARSTRAPLR
jgi:hypothetical protein